MDSTSPLFSGIAGQARAVSALEAAARRPVHAYLLVGPPGAGKEDAAVSFAASLLCPAAQDGDPADGACATCRRVLAGVHPDSLVIEREGPFITMDDARAISSLSTRSPLEGHRQVLILHDFHLVRDAGPALLKTIEEPPASTFFVILADHVPTELVTIASRCVRIDFSPLTPADIEAALRAEGLPAAQAAHLAAAAGGRLDRARLLARDRGFEARHKAWRELPDRLDGTGAAAAAIAGELVGLLEQSVEPLRERQAEELAALEEQLKVSGGTGRPARASRGAAAAAKDLEERHKRELRRFRTDELRAGLTALADSYRQRLAAGGSTSGDLAALQLIDQLGRDMQHNPGELLALQALLVRLGSS